MNCKRYGMDMKAFWRAVLAQDEPKIRTYFAPDAYVNWHCTNEHFTVKEFIIANCEYPGEWDGVVERIDTLDGLTVTVTRVYPKDRSRSFHVTSFIRAENDKIVSLDEYWADDGSAPQWRLDKHIGTPIGIDYIEAHEFASNHREKLLKDRKCGCFCCLKIFDPKEIQSWIKDTSGTALCPYCGVDSVIGEYSGYPITTEFLKKLQHYWF